MDSAIVVVVVVVGCCWSLLLVVVRSSGRCCWQWCSTSMMDDKGIGDVVATNNDGDA